VGLNLNMGRQKWSVGEPQNIQLSMYKERRPTSVTLRIGQDGKVEDERREKRNTGGRGRQLASPCAYGENFKKKTRGKNVGKRVRGESIT